ncbi:transcription initiation factor IID, 18kD subunit-domain-containing protein [Fusarium flagelliforme]|uniref:transcription initiation factor IID, 18kD subunit-domain-containing protein n=1 Tax=Fusarium flagelliforme TaxID=2675880 RepID=UPI001E8DB518|nr:transcription initiation factor IID, 18kD subunit-domain-containing protein [Fusarium flagelliforme]KAH7185120.1 transcription initiation factor IID, 18kD subunit-domain-containing protein [Fusarium flagelliforme]
MSLSLPATSGFTPKYRNEIQQMMYVAGETQDVSLETLTLVEQIVQDQVRHILSTASDLAAHAGKKTVSLNHIIFQVRHDEPRVQRIKCLLQWRAIRLEAKKRNKDTQDDVEIDDPDELSDDLLESPTVEEAAAKRTEPAAATLPWDVESYYSVIPPGGDTNEKLLNDPGEDSLQRLRWADEVTKAMTSEEYAMYSDYRHASFTTRKAKRFREWAGIGVVADIVKKEDSLESLGFLAAGMVKRLTDIALTIQAQDLAAQRARVGLPLMKPGHMKYGLFVTEGPEREPIDVGHIRRAFRETQAKPKKKRVQLNRVIGPRHLELI